MIHTVSYFRRSEFKKNEFFHLFNGFRQAEENKGQDKNNEQNPHYPVK